MLILLYHQCIFHNMKIVVYTIAKNEEKFVERWYESMKEADELKLCIESLEAQRRRLIKETVSYELSGASYATNCAQI